MKPTMVVLAGIACASFGQAGWAAADEAAAHPVFTRVFGDAVALDAAQCTLVREGAPGERHYVDKDGDGQPEEVWFIDTAKRHREAARPLLVRVIDEDGDLRMGQEPDLDSDLYVADWKADGVVDVVCDYTDTDGDNDVDEMGLYFPGGRGLGAAEALTVWWGKDIGDDNLLWYDVDYTYNQSACQYRTHFGGNEEFCAYSLGLDWAEWLPQWENPFLFYDNDGDGVTEEVIRIEGKGTAITNLRYSFDADNDATPDSPRDFDVSLNAYGTAELALPEDVSERFALRGIPTGPVLRYDAARAFSRETAWASMMLCWDENDLNINGRDYRESRFADPQERWEGVICSGNDQFHQIGGPDAGPLNKRYELATAPRNPMRLYYAPTDQRLHLFGAATMWLAVDLDYDRTPDMRYDYLDTDGDGYIDTWRLDVNSDGQPDDEWTAQGAPMTDVAYTWADVNAVMQPLMAAAPEQLAQLDARLQQALEQLGEAGPDAVRTLIESGFDVEPLEQDVRVRLLSSNESLRFYLDLLKDRLIVQLKARHADPAFWETFAGLRAQGDWDGLRRLVEQRFSLDTPLPDAAVDGLRARGLAKYAQPQVAWAQDWVPPNIGWEALGCGYRAYWGQFDFFGKSRDALVMHTFADKVNYHAEQDWGMDALHVGTACGLGGVTLYVNGQGYPVWSPEGKGTIVWSKRLVSEDAGQVTVELLAEQAGPSEAPYTVRFHCSAVAGRKDSPIVVMVEGGRPEDRIELGIGLVKLAQEDFALDREAGVMASWGVQEPAIGVIGLGVIYPPEAFVRAEDLPEQHEVVLRAEKAAALTYHIQGDWLRGRRFPRCPTLGNWVEELRATARVTALR